MSQAALLMVAIAIVGGFVLDQRQKEAAEQVRRDEAEAARLERAGVERRRAAAIAVHKAAELRAMEQPLPLTGVMRRYAPNSVFHSPGGLPELIVEAPADASYLVKLSDWNTGVPVMVIFVRASTTAHADVPFGRYRIRMASGTAWYGDIMRFRPDTSYSEIDSISGFSLSGDQLVGHHLQLTKIVNGNLRPVPIGAEVF